MAEQKEGNKKLDKSLKKAKATEKNKIEKEVQSGNQSLPSPYLMTYFSSHIRELL